MLKPCLLIGGSLLLAACADTPPHPADGTAVAPTAGASVVVTQLAPPAVLLEHPGRPPATGYLWIAGYWNWSGARYDWVPGRWVAPRPGQVWVSHVWRRDGDGWRQEGGRWEARREGRQATR